MQHIRSHMDAQELLRCRMLLPVRTTRTHPTLTTRMTITFPRREKAAAKVGPRLEISPLELKQWLGNEHGLSQILLDATSWEPFAWKGNELSAPLRALYAAEARGLLAKNGQRANAVPIADITAEINSALLSVGKSPVSEGSVLNNLRHASLYLNASVNVAIIPDRKSMTVRLVDEFETVESIERYFDAIKSKLQKLGSQLKHAEALGYDVGGVLAAAEHSSGLRILAAA